MLSAIMAVMNKEKVFEKTLPSWTKVLQITDFVIVDWSSEKPIIENKIVQEQIEKFKNIKIVRVEGQKYYKHIFAYNLASQYTHQKNKILLKLDADYFNLNSEWINFLALKKDHSLDDYFITGSSRFASGTTGFLVVNKTDFGKGFNENIIPTYGVDDLSLIETLSKKLIKTSWLDIESPTKEWIYLKQVIFFNIAKYMLHIDHTDEERLKNLERFKDYQKTSYLLKEDNLKSWKIYRKFPDWEPKKYETLEASDNYIKVKMID